MKDYATHYSELQGLMGKLKDGIPKTMSGFESLHKASTADGALSKKVKELISLGIAVTVRCDGCIAFHVKGSLSAGASREEMLETIGVAVLMGGGPSVMYGCEALAAIEQFEDAE